MTKNNKLTSSRKILVFILSIIMCLSLFFAAACKEETDDSSTIPEFSYVDKSDCDIDNPDFTYGTANLTYSEYPKISATGWNIAKNATSKSGVIDVSDKGWKALLSNLAKDSGILNYVKYINGNFTDADIKEQMIEEFPDKYDNDQKKPTTSQIREYIVDKYFIQPETPNEDITYPFTNPTKHSNATDNKVYMLNNYKTGDLGFGCIQSLNSAKNIVLKPGEYAKVSAFVKTENLNSVYNKSVGANIRIANSFNSESQSDFGIFNITATDWTEYVFYIKSDSVYDTSFALALGLGYGDYSVEGTAYFDDITVKVLSENQYLEEIENQTAAGTFAIEYKAEDNSNLLIEAENYDSQKYYLYDMSLSLNDIANFTEIGSFSNDPDFTKNNDGITIGNITGESSGVFTFDKNSSEFDDVPYGIDEGLKVELNKPASITVKLDNNGSNFELGAKQYSAITFFVKNQLSKLFAKDITINIQGESKDDRHLAVATISEISDEWSKCTVFVKNNSNDVNRKFYLEIVIGPKAYQEDIDMYAKGTVYVSNPIIATGSMNQYNDAGDEISSYKYFNLLSSTANGTVALHEDDTTTNNEVYNFTVALSDAGTIMDSPAIPNAYSGIKFDGEKVVVSKNDKSGLINSKYQDNYEIEIKNALNYDDNKNNIQPLMITPTADGASYGFMSNGYYTILSNSYASISVSLKVTGTAKAYIYLVDVSEKEKDVLKFDEFKVNTDAGFFKNNGQTISEKSLSLTVDESMMNGQDWITVEFYIATGFSKKDFRIELWNGERSNASPLTSNGYVFINSVDVVTENAFNLPNNLGEAFTYSGENINNPLLGRSPEFIVDKETPVVGTELIAHQRVLTDIEKEYNADESKQGSNISYSPQYIWAKTNTMIYAVYNSIDPTEINPYDSEPVEDETDDTSLIKTDPATFWLSFSSILLGVALVVAIIMLFIKNIRRRRKATKSDAKSHYTVRSRVRKAQEPVNKAKVEENIDDFEPIMEPETNEQSEETEQSLDDYVYGDVQDFGENSNQNKSDE